jgi:hypothetical protein
MPCSSTLADRSENPPWRIQRMMPNDAHAAPSWLTTGKGDATLFVTLLSEMSCGWVAPGGFPPGAPTDPDVLALEHPVPRPTDSPSVMVPRAIRSSYGDMRKNLDVFSMFPPIGSAGRRFASLHRVLGASSSASTVLSRRYDFLPSFSPRFVSFAWRYHAVRLGVRSLRPRSQWRWTGSLGVRRPPGGRMSRWTR